MFDTEKGCGINGPGRLAARILAVNVKQKNTKKRISQIKLF
ncbi:hypothetical protein D1AOALGA4SA_496 [Olavius algarvensis Delta 1 endosymbiont]|nr:hypothetical protein D1AOALGA4SA_496 [Olavius algarvensis Delta 1 endosymbiont]